jgi:hypothetical protein
MCQVYLKPKFSVLLREMNRRERESVRSWEERERERRGRAATHRLPVLPAAARPCAAGDSLAAICLRISCCAADRRAARSGTPPERAPSRPHPAPARDRWSQPRRPPRPRDRRPIAHRHLRLSGTTAPIDLRPTAALPPGLHLLAAPLPPRRSSPPPSSGPDRRHRGGATPANCLISS